MINPETIELSSLPSLSLLQRKDLPEVSGIYFVINNQGVIQYIGKSINLKQRWQQHHRLSQLEELPDIKIAWLEVSDHSLLLEIERALIHWFKPSLNRRRVRKIRITKRKRGNPEFGTLYRIGSNREKPLSEQVKVLMYPEMKHQLKDLADQKNCTVPDLIREAIEQYLLMYPQMKHQLKDLADQKNCTVLDLIREAVEQYLASITAKQAS
jgi:predicted DNA-binding protein